MLRFIIIFLIIAVPAFASDYGVYSPQNYKLNSNEGERLLFILDFSNSMNQFVGGKRKVDLMLDTMRNLLPNLRPDISVGRRVYGHKMSFSGQDYSMVVS